MFALEITEESPVAPGDLEWRSLARCATGTGTLIELFFSEQIDDINRAKSFCMGCEVKDECLSAAQERAEPWGVWGGELFLNGKVLAEKRRRGRPPKVRVEAPAVPSDPFAGLIGPTSQIA